MKATMLITVALLMSSNSFALVSDQFKCRLEVKDLASDSSTTANKEFFIARLPLSASPAPDVRLTAGQTTESLTLDTEKAKLTANLNFYYKHAIRIDANGKPIEARQFTCVGLSGDYCEKSNDSDDVYACSDSRVACLERPDPFNPKSGWSPTGLIGGEPTFNEQALGATKELITDNKKNPVGAISLSCQFMGSYQ